MSTTEWVVIAALAFVAGNMTGSFGAFVYTVVVEIRDDIRHIQLARAIHPDSETNPAPSSGTGRGVDES